MSFYICRETFLVAGDFRGSEATHGDKAEACDSATSSQAIGACAERHYTVAEIAKLWQLSPDAVRRLFRNEPGVVVLGGTGPRVRKRKYLTLRIPQSVLERVHRQYSL